MHPSLRSAVPIQLPGLGWRLHFLHTFLQLRLRDGPALDQVVRREMARRDREETEHHRAAEHLPEHGPMPPDRRRSKVCRLNEENVVKPPQMPTITNKRVVSETA